MDWAPLVVKDLVELILRLFILLTTWSAIHGADSVIWHAFACRIPLVAGPSTVVVKLPVVVVVTKGSGCVLTPLRLPSAASCRVAPVLSWGDYAQSHGREIGQ